MPSFRAIKSHPLPRFFARPEPGAANAPARWAAVIYAPTAKEVTEHRCLTHPEVTESKSNVAMNSLSSCASNRLRGE